MHMTVSEFEKEKAAFDGAYQEFLRVTDLAKPVKAREWKCILSGQPFIATKDEAAMLKRLSDAQDMLIPAIDRWTKIYANIEYLVKD